MAGLLIVAILVLMASLAPLLTISNGETVAVSNRLQAPSALYWLGTDELGRDVFERIVWGARTTLYVVMLVTVIVVPIGLVVGIVSGYVGGLVDQVLMRVTDIFLAFPRLILALAFVAVLGAGVENAVLAIALTAWPPIARLSRAETLIIRNSEFILAAQMQGTSTSRILFKHVAPLCIPSIIVRMTLDTPGTILTVAGLGFLGLGVQPPTPEWGAMIANSWRFVLLDQWWVPTIPGIAIFVACLGFNLLGDGLRDVLDPKGRQ